MSQDEDRFDRFEKRFEETFTKFSDKLDKNTEALIVLSGRFDGQEKKLKSLGDDIWGTGENNLGLKSKFQTVWDHVKLVKWAVGLIIPALVGLFVKAFWK